MSRSHMPSYADKGTLTQGSIRGHLVRLTIPMTWGILAMISFQLVNIFYISFLGTEKLTAISFTFPVTYAVFSLNLGFSIATSSVLSRQLGSGNKARARRITTHALILSLINGLICAVIGCALITPIFTAMGAPDDMIPLIRDYMLIWFAGSMLINTPLICNAALRAGGDSLTPAFIMLGAAGLNMVVDPILIFGLFGFPRLELQGAAISTVISNGTALAVALYIIAVRRKMLSRNRRPLRLFADSLKRLLFIALPAGFTGMVLPLSNAIIIALLAGISTEAVAAFGIVSRVEAFAFIIIMALATGMAPIIGQNWGAESYDRVRLTLKEALRFAVLWSAFIAVILAAFATPIASIFSQDTEIVQIAALYFLIVPISAVCGNLAQGWASAFNAIGKPQRAVVMIVTRLLVLNIPLAWLGAHYFGIIGIFGALALTNIISGLAFHIISARYLRRWELKT